MGPTPGRCRGLGAGCAGTANLRTKILDFRGLDSSIILSVSGGILRSIGNSPDMLSQRILVGIILVGRLGVVTAETGREVGEHRPGLDAGFGGKRPRRPSQKRCSLGRSERVLPLSCPLAF